MGNCSNNLYQPCCTTSNEINTTADLKTEENYYVQAKPTLKQFSLDTGGSLLTTKFETLPRDELNDWTPTPVKSNIPPATFWRVNSLSDLPPLDDYTPKTLELNFDWTMSSDGKAFYKGSWLSGKFHGYGQLVIARKSLYEGTFKNGLFHGYGRFIDEQGNYYQGEFKDGLSEGQGTYVVDHINYTGEWREDKQHGKGVERTIGGHIYEGDYVNGEKTGKCKIIFNDESVYEGGIKCGKFNGYGRIMWSDGKVFEGNFKNGLKDGLGSLSIPRKGKFEGNYKKGSKNGSGSIIFDKEVRLEGNWLGGEIKGQCCVRLLSKNYMVVFKGNKIIELPDVDEGTAGLLRDIEEKLLDFKDGFVNSL